MWVGSAQISGSGTNPENNGPILAQHIFSLFFGPGQTRPIRLGHNWPDPKLMLIICRTWTVVHVLHATEMVAENEGCRRSGSLEAGVSAVIRRLCWWFWWRRWEEWWPESITGEGRRILQRWERGRNGDCFRNEGDQRVVGLATCGGAGGGSNGGGREGETNCRNEGRGAGFLPTLVPIFSSPRPGNPPLFIGGGREQSCLYQEKISALDSVGKDPNHCLKVGILSCQIWIKIILFWLKLFFPKKINNI